VSISSHTSREVRLYKDERDEVLIVNSRNDTELWILSRGKIIDVPTFSKNETSYYDLTSINKTVCGFDMVYEGHNKVELIKSINLDRLLNRNRPESVVLNGTSSNTQTVQTDNIMIYPWFDQDTVKWDRVDVPIIVTKEAEFSVPDVFDLSFAAGCFRIC
jgi:hypothetical protein